jgi:hypothetical protein
MGRAAVHWLALQDIDDGVAAIRETVLRKHPEAGPENPLASVDVLWDANAGNLGTADVVAWLELLDESVVAATAKPSAARDVADRFALITSDEPLPANFAMPGRAAYDNPDLHYRAIDTRLASALAARALPAECESPQALERLTRLLVAQGFADFGLNPQRRAKSLETATAILSNAAQLVPGFNPDRAGLRDAYQRLAEYFAVLRAQPDEVRRNHPGLTMQEAVGTLHASLTNVETAMAACILRSNVPLRLPDSPVTI